MSDPDSSPRFLSSPTRCPYCHESVAADGAVVCVDCLARHHAECWAEHGCCSSCQSERQLQSVGASPPAPSASRSPVRDPALLGLLVVAALGNWFLLQQGSVEARMEGPALTLLLGLLAGLRSRDYRATLALTTLATLVGTLSWWLDHRYASLALNLVAALGGGVLLGLPGCGVVRALGPRAEAAPPGPTERLVTPSELESPERRAPPGKEKA